MKKLLLSAAFVCLLAGQVFAQSGAPSLMSPYARTFNFDASENSPCFRLTDNAVQEHQMIIREVASGVVGGTVKLTGYDTIDCNGSGTDIIPATSWTASTETAIYHGSYASVRMIGASYSGSGAVAVTYLGYIVKFEASSDNCEGRDLTEERYVSVGTSEDENEYSATAATLCGIEIANAHSTAGAWVKCTNLTAASTTPGSSTIHWDFFAAPNATSGNNNIRRTFSTAITCYIVLGKTAAAVDEVGADDVHVTLYYINN